MTVSSFDIVEDEVHCKKYWFSRDTGSKFQFIKPPTTYPVSNDLISVRLRESRAIFSPPATQ